MPDDCVFPGKRLGERALRTHSFSSLSPFPLPIVSRNNSSIHNGRNSFENSESDNEKGQQRQISDGGFTREEKTEMGALISDTFE